MASTERQIRRAMLALAGHPAIGPRLVAAEAAVAVSAGGDLLWANPAAIHRYGPSLTGAGGLIAALHRHRRSADATAPAVARLRMPTARGQAVVCRLEPVVVDGEAALLAVVLDPPAVPGDVAARLEGLLRALAGDRHAAILDGDDNVLAKTGPPRAAESGIVAIAGTPWRIVVSPTPDTGADDRPPAIVPAAAAPLRWDVSPGADGATPSSATEPAPTPPRDEPRGANRPAARRFTWQTDADDRFTFVSAELVAAVGTTGRIVGRRWQEIAESLDLDPAGRVAANLARRLTWSGVTVDWPTAEGVRAPVDLAGLSLTGPDGDFTGFRGFGTVRQPEPGRTIAPPTAVEAAPPVEPPPADRPESENTPPAASKQSVSDGSMSPAEPAPEDVGTPGLSRPEWEAFRLVAAALGARFEGDPAAEPDAGGADVASAAMQGVRHGPVAHPGPRGTANAAASESALAASANGRRLAVPAAANDAGLLDRIPVALLVCRGDRLIHANPAALALLGYRDVAGLAAAGGLAALFVEPAPADSRPVRVRRADGGTDAVDARLTSIPWNGGSALLVALTAGAARTPVPVEPDDGLLDGVVDAVLVLGPGGAVLAANRAGERLFGVPREALIGRGFPALAAPEARLSVAAAIQAAGSGAGDRVETIPVLVADGAARDVVVSIGRAGDGASARLCAVLRPAGPTAADTADTDRAARAATETSMLVAHLGHEVRTPINAIVGFAELMLEERLGPLGEPRYRDYLRDVRASGLHVLSLVDDLLDLARVEAGHAELERAPVPLNDIVRETVSMMQATAAQARIVLRLALSDALPPVIADRRSLRQILLNLLSNAVKFNVSGGQVIVSTGIDGGGAVTLRVRDTGIGMTGAEAAMALEPFRRVHGARYGGTGLGLPLTKALAEANGAEFTIASEPRRGTLVEVTFAPAAAVAQTRDAVV